MKRSLVIIGLAILFVLAFVCLAFPGTAVTALVEVQAKILQFKNNIALEFGDSNLGSIEAVVDDDYVGVTGPMRFAAAGPPPQFLDGAAFPADKTICFGSGSTNCYSYVTSSSAGVVTGTWRYSGSLYADSGLYMKTGDPIHIGTNSEALIEYNADDDTITDDDATGSVTVSGPAPWNFSPFVSFNGGAMFPNGLDVLAGHTLGFIADQKHLWYFQMDSGTHDLDLMQVADDDVVGEFDINVPVKFEFGSETASGYNLTLRGQTPNRVAEIDASQHPVSGSIVTTTFHTIMGRLAGLGHTITYYLARKLGTATTISTHLNQQCVTTCGADNCICGQDVHVTADDDAGTGTLVNCTDATADICVCAGTPIDDDTD
jgi:hypothetical protein